MCNDQQVSARAINMLETCELASCRLITAPSAVCRESPTTSAQGWGKVKIKSRPKPMTPITNKKLGVIFSAYTNIMYCSWRTHTVNLHTDDSLLYRWTSYRNINTHCTAVTLRRLQLQVTHTNTNLLHHLPVMFTYMCLLAVLASLWSLWHRHVGGVVPVCLTAAGYVEGGWTRGFVLCKNWLTDQRYCSTDCPAVFSMDCNKVCYMAVHYSIV